MQGNSFGIGSLALVLGGATLALCLACNSPDSLGGNEGPGGSGNGGAGGVIINLSAVGGVSGTVGSGGVGGGAGTDGLTQGVCGDTTITPNKAPVDVLLVLDRSDSMGYSMSGDCYCSSWPSADRQGSLCSPQPANCVDRWAVVSSAVIETINSTPSLNWGLELFSGPNSPSCSVATVPQVAIAANSGPQIQSILSSMDLQLWTPTALAVNVAGMYLNGVSDGNQKAILLATDGEPNCKGGKTDSASDMEATSAAVTAAGFPVYVVGIGPTEALANLDLLAQYGGTGHYYPAETPQALAESLAAIAKIIETNCEYLMPTLPPDPEKVYVYVDRVLVQKSDADGWTFGATSTADIVLTGSYCANMKAGITSSVKIVFGCPGYIPPQSIP
jgi:hypothetical protein